jgi:CDGSH-type Zn-finger protein
VATSREALMAQRGLFALELRARETYAWCACGRSFSQPFCDGGHKETGLLPVVKTELHGTAYLYRCKTSQGRLFCDGSHRRL